MMLLSKIKKEIQFDVEMRRTERENKLRKMKKKKAAAGPL